MSQSPHTRETRLLALLFALVSAAIIGGAYAYYRYYRASLTREKSDLLSSIAATKIDEIAAWRAERLRDTASLLDSPLLTPALASFAASPGDKQLADVIKRRLEAFIRNNRYRGAYLLGAGGRVYISAGEPLTSLKKELPEADELIEKAAAAGAPLIGKLHLRAADGAPVFHIVAPAARLPSGKRLFLLISADPRVYLYPLVEKWPTNSPTAETLLVRREGDYVLFVNPLRHLKSAALKMKLPLANEELPAAMLLSGRRGIVTGYDYRGHKVLAYLSMIPDASLGMVAKVDEAEIFRDLHRYSVLLFLLTAAMLAAAGAGTYLLIGRREREYARSLLAAQAEKEKYRLNYETLAAKAGDALIITDLADMRILEANAKAAETYGYPAEKLRGLPMERLIPEGGREAFRERTSLNLAEGNRHYAAEHLRKDGAVFPAEITATVLSSGGRKLMFSIIRDVSERHRDEALIRENEAIFAAFLKHSPVHIFFKDKDLRALRLSDNYSSMLGMPVERALGRTMEELFPSDLARGMMEDDRRVLEEGKTATVKETMGGRVYETTKFPVYHEGRPIMLAGFTLDITEREKAATDLRESERRLSTLISTLPGIAYRYRNDENRTLEFLSEGCLELTGYAAADFVTGRKTSFRDIVLPEDRPALAAAVDRAVKEGGHYKVSYRIRHRSGEVRTVWEAGSPVRAENGAVTAFEGLITDVSALKATEAERDRLLERLTVTLEETQIGTWEWDVANDVWSAAATYFTMLGYPPEPGPSDRAVWLERVHPDDRAGVADKIRGVLEGLDVKYQYEARMLHADGSYRWHSVLGKTIQKDASGKPLRIIGVRIDITARRQAEESLRDSERALKGAQRLAKIGNWELDLKTNVLSWSDEIFRIFELDPEKFGASYDSFLEAIHPDDREMVNKAYTDSVRDRTSYDITHRLMMRNGKVKYVNEFCETFYDEAGKPVKSVGTVQDVTDRKRNEEINAARVRLMQFAAGHSLDELLEETLNHAENLTSSLIGFYHFVDDDQNSLTLQNWSARTKAKFCTAEGKGRHYPIADAGVWVECVRLRAPVIHNDYASLPNRKGLPPGHAAVVRELVVPVIRGGKIKAILGIGNKSCDYDQNDVEAVSLLADLAWEVTERKRAEEQRELYARNLAEKNKELEDFLYIASHDLRGPMVNIQGFSQNLQKYCGEIAAQLPPDSAAGKPRLEELLKSRVPEALGFLLGSAAKMDGLINSLLKVSRLGRTELNPAPLDMDKFLAELAAAMDFQVKEARAELRLGPLPWCVADKAQLSQVFSNLLENSLKYRSGDRKPVIEVTGTATEDGWAEYSVSDNGIGLSEKEVAGRIWTPFYRAQPRGEIKGEGLGLTAAKRIVERHGGEIRAARAEGGGARFTVKLKAWRPT